MKLNQRTRKTEGSAVLVIVILLGVMAMLVISNAVALQGLKKEMRLIEREQLKKYQQQPAVEAKKAIGDGQNLHD